LPAVFCGQETVIDGNIIVRIVSISGSAVRLGMSAPENVAVDRKEVHDRRAEFITPRELEVIL
jgi:carbon storage regulator CsrA